VFAENGNKFKNLKWIYLWDNQITNTGLEEFSKNGDKFESLQKKQQNYRGWTEGTGLEWR
jgi:hypothetical protein